MGRARAFHAVEGRSNPDEGGGERPQPAPLPRRGATHLWSRHPPERAFRGVEVRGSEGPWGVFTIGSPQTRRFRRLPMRFGAIGESA